MPTNDMLHIDWLIPSRYRDGHLPIVNDAHGPVACPAIKIGSRNVIAMIYHAGPCEWSLLRAAGSEMSNVCKYTEYFTNMGKYLIYNTDSLEPF